MAEQERLKSITISISTFENAMKQFDRAAARLNVDPGLMGFLKQPRRSNTVKLPVRMDDGSFQMFTGYRVQHSIVRGPAKGGKKYHPNVTLDEVQAFEWVQDKMGYFWTEEDVNARLKRFMVSAFNDILKVAKDNDVHMRIAAFMVGIQRVADVVMLRGIYA